MLKDTACESVRRVGRRIPVRVAPVNRRARYTLVQPAIDYAEIHARIVGHMRRPTPVSATEFAERAEAFSRRSVGAKKPRRCQRVRSVRARPRTGHDDSGRRWKTSTCRRWRVLESPVSEG